MLRSVSFVLFVLFAQAFSAQEMLRGRVIDGELGDPVFSANVIVEGTTQGVTTDFDGQFLLSVSQFPVNIQVSFIGYGVKKMTVLDASERITVKLMPDQVLIEAAEVVGDRISQKQKQAPLTVESMDVIAIKEAIQRNV